MCSFSADVYTDERSRREKRKGLGKKIKVTKKESDNKEEINTQRVIFGGKRWGEYIEKQNV